MRFFTVSNPRSARQSLVYATSLIAVFQLMVIVLGLGAIALVGDGQVFPGHKEALGGSANLAVVYLAQMLGGSVLFGVVAAVTFATIVAVVSGLTLAAAAAVSHDLYRHVIRGNQASESQELRVSRLTTAIIGLLAIVFGLAFRNQNIGFLATLPLVIAASSSFPILMLAMYWRRLTTWGAVVGGYVGLVSSVSLVLMGPKVWTGVLGHSTRALSFDYGTLISLSAAILVACCVSMCGRAGDRV
jgi:cation/acetate symporter